MNKQYSTFYSTTYSQLNTNISYGEKIKKHFQTNLQSSYVKKSKKLLVKRPQDDSNNESSLIIARKPADSLNSWIRQQGGGHSSDILLSKLQQRTKITINESNSNENIIDMSRTTPKPFHLKCIDDVLKYNEPKNMFIDDPKELLYIKKLPYLKLSILGVGKTKDLLWQLKTEYES
jgi:hypothetical protein